MSEGFGCRTRRVEGGGYALLVPLGMPARIKVLARLLLGYWGRERGARVIRSALDNIAGDPRSVPPMLQAVFLEDLPAEQFWSGLGQLDSSIGADAQPFEADVQELV